MYVIGICGASCSGKSKAAREIANTFKVGDVTIINQDRYYFSGSSTTNYDIPDAIDFKLLIEHIKELIKGKEIEAPTYNFIKHKRSKKTQTIHPSKILILEGILIFTQKELRDLIELKVFISSYNEIAFCRRIDRDVCERGRDIEEVKKRYFRDVLPSSKLYIEPCENYADIVLKNNINEQFIGLKILLDHIHVRLKFD